jgi:DNA-binding ferritin-like protein
LLVSAIAAILSGVAVFTNVRIEEPPKDDPRIQQILDCVNEIKSLADDIHQFLPIVERKIDKDTKESRAEMKESFDKVVMYLDKLLHADDDTD